MKSESGFHHIHGEAFFDDFETEMRESLEALNVRIIFNPCNYPFFDIEFDDIDDRVMKLLRKLVREKRINIIGDLPIRSSNVHRKKAIKQIDESKRKRKRAKPTLTKIISKWFGPH